MATPQAVLPPPTGWGFEPKTSNQMIKSKSNNSLANQSFFGSSPVASDVSRRTVKRKNFEDSDMSSDRNSPYSSPSSSNDLVHRRRRDSRLSPSSKRARVYKGLVSTDLPIKHSRQPLPISRMLESLDRKELEGLVIKLCESHGQGMINEIGSIVPRMTTSVALGNLKKHFDAVFNALPYRVSEHSDYAFYRVKPYLDEFMSALVDYGLYFLPPNESQPSTSLTFLETATQLLCSLPNWDNPMHNHPKYSLLDELSSAWIMSFKEASKSSNAVNLMLYNGWEKKLESFNESSNNHLSAALNYLRQELAWANEIPGNSVNTTSSPQAIRVSTNYGVSNF